MTSFVMFRLKKTLIFSGFLNLVQSEPKSVALNMEAAG
jgi:hypothetical protein